MKLENIQTPVSSVSGVGPETAKTLSKLKIFTIADLLSYYPVSYEDRTEINSIADFTKIKRINTIVQVERHEWFGFGKMRTLKILINDGSTDAVLICFNRPFLEKMYPIGSILFLSASFTYRYQEIQASSFDAQLISRQGTIEEFTDKAKIFSKVVPQYSLTQGLTNTQLRKVISRALKEYCKGIDNDIPNEFLVKYNYINKQDAINLVHNPETLLQTQQARESLIYQELFNFQLTILERALKHRGKLPSIQDTITANPEALSQPTEDSSELTDINLSPLQKQLFNRLPFSLTKDQIKVLIEINEDIDTACFHNNSNKIEAPKDFSMARLLQGDVGSGKTLVAFLACLRIIDYKGQCAFLAPTELLARQHADNAAKYLEPLGVKIAFLTGNIKAKGRNTLLQALEKNEIDLVIGTHALFSNNVQYSNLKLIIIDEQHRFGVIQRNQLIEKGIKSKNGDGTLPNLLMMSATPIPRTLALTVFGDLDVSVIKTMPNGRKPIITHLTKKGNENIVYEAVRKELQKGHQAYFVYPLIEKTEEEIPIDKLDFKNDELKSAEDMYEFLSTQVYPEFKCALVHSKIDEEEQHQILDDYRLGKIDIIIATTVVEVGVDVPNATCMVIEHADRFGLAALHQLRGRVGRGNDQSQCFLIYGSKLSEIGKSRLKAMHETTDGFIIAEQDLKLRGPGEVSGIQQSGYLTLGIADPIRDHKLLLKARNDAIIYLSSQQAL